MNREKLEDVIFNYACMHASHAEAMAALDEYTRTVQAAALSTYLDRLGVDATDDQYGEWWDGYRQAQREAILNLGGYIAREADRG